MSHRLLTCFGLAALAGILGAGGCAGKDFTTAEDAGRGGNAEGGEGGDDSSSGGAAATGGRAGASNEPDAGAGGDDGNPGGPRPCDVRRSPSEDSCLVDEMRAIFVAPSGDDADAGTRESPVRTLQRAVQLGQETGSIVIACAGAFDEHLAIDGHARIYGGFGCPDDDAPWIYDAERRTVLAPASRGVALTIRDATARVAIEDFDIKAQGAVELGESSVAAFVASSRDVAFTRVTLRAGIGRSGAQGTLSPTAFPGPALLAGNQGAQREGAAAPACECEVGASGPGGAGGYVTLGGEVGLPDHIGPGGEGGIARAECVAGGRGWAGAAAPASLPADNATRWGMLTQEGWLPEAGSAGAVGQPGQGGGGGAGTGFGGGSGGCGGCGGRGGGAGHGGGASVGLLMLDSTIDLVDLEILVSHAGDGGDGMLGQPGQAQGGAGGPGFIPNNPYGGCSGGPGGAGGRGGPGGGGAGGISAGIAYAGDAPMMSSVTVALGEPGLGGRNGNVAAGTGIDGRAEEILDVAAPPSRQ